MTLVATDGFDFYNGTTAGVGLPAKWTLASATLTTGRFGGQGMICNNGPTGVRAFTAARANGAIGVAIKSTALPNNNGVVLPTIQFYSGATTQFGIMFGSDGSVKVYRLSSGTAGTLLASSAAGVVVAGGWNYFEVVFICHSSTGAIDVKMDGASIATLTLTGINNNNAGTGTVDRIMFGNAFGNGQNQIFDDYYENDTDAALGPMKITPLRPSADTVEKDFARSTGSDNYALVDETLANGDTDYVQGSTVGDLDRYEFGDLTGSPTVLGVTAIIFAESTDAAARSICASMDSGGTTSDGPNFALAASSYNKYERCMAVDPNTTAAWAASAVNSLKGGPKVTV